jgi:hypothetical protein
MLLFIKTIFHHSDILKEKFKSKKKINLKNEFNFFFLNFLYYLIDNFGGYSGFEFIFHSFFKIIYQGYYFLFFIINLIRIITLEILFHGLLKNINILFNFIFFFLYFFFQLNIISWMLQRIVFSKSLIF